MDFALSDFVVKIAVEFTVGCFAGTHYENVIRHLVEVKCLASKVIFLKLVGGRRR